MSKLEPFQHCSFCPEPDARTIAGIRLCPRHLELVEEIAIDAGVPREAEVSNPVAKLHSSQQMVECSKCLKVIKGAGPAAVHRKNCGRTMHEVVATEHRAPSTEHRAPSDEKTSQPPPQARNIKIADIAHFDISRIGTIAKFVGISEAEVARLIGCLEYIAGIAGNA